MTNSIPQAAIDAVAETYEQIADEDHEYRDLIGIDWTIIRDGLEAAMPYIRKQIADEIRAGWVELDEVWAEAVKAYHADGYTQPPDDYDRMFWDAGLADAVRIVEGDQ